MIKDHSSEEEEEEYLASPGLSPLPQKVNLNLHLNAVNQTPSQIEQQKSNTNQSRKP
jgi:hypothetical protein